MLMLEKQCLTLAGTELSGGSFRCVFNSGEFPVQNWEKQGAGWTAVLANGFRLNLTLDGDTLLLSGQNGELPDFLKQINIDFPAVLEAGEYLEYTHSRLFLEQASGVKKVGLSTPFFTHNPPSYLVYLLVNERKKQNFLFAALPPHQGDSMVFQAFHDSIGMRGKFGVRITVEEDRDLDPGMKFEVSPLLFCCADRDPLEMLENLGDRYAAVRKFPLRPRSVGWNSWDQFRKDVTEEKVLKNQRKLNEFTEGKVKYFVVDDGWQLSYGAWQSNLKFPSGIREFCRKITAQGGIPGIWTAPLLVDNDCTFPSEWLCCSKVKKGWFLDVTRPEVLAYLSRLYRQLAEDGIRYFKVDFTNNVYFVERFYDMRCGRTGILRRLYETIRRAIGPDSYLLGCCVPFEPAFNVVDAARITADIQIFWSAFEINMVSASARWWLHKRFWNNDPDFFVVRGPETAVGKFNAERPYTQGDYGSGPALNHTEAMTLALAVYMTGGDLIPGDNVLMLNDDGKKILYDILQLPDPEESARPLDLFSAGHGAIPAFWYLPKSRKLAVFNWTEETRTMVWNPTPYGLGKAHPFWNGREVRRHADGTMEITLSPHESTGLEFERL